MILKILNRALLKGGRIWGLGGGYSNIKEGRLDFGKTKFVPESYYQSIQEHRIPRKGDILYSVVGSYGIPAMVDVDKKFCFQRHIALLKPSKYIHNKYLLLIRMNP